MEAYILSLQVGEPPRCICPRMVALVSIPVAASYGMTDTLGRMHSDAQFAGSSSVPAHVEMMGLIGAGNNPMVGMTVAVAVAVQEAADAGKF